MSIHSFLVRRANSLGQDPHHVLAVFQPGAVVPGAGVVLQVRAFDGLAQVLPELFSPGRHHYVAVSGFERLPGHDVRVLGPLAPV